MKTKVKNSYQILKDLGSAYLARLARLNFQPGFGNKSSENPIGDNTEKDSAWAENPSPVRNQRPIFEATTILYDEVHASV